MSHVCCKTSPFCIAPIQKITSEVYSMQQTLVHYRLKSLIFEQNTVFPMNKTLTFNELRNLL